MKINFDIKTIINKHCDVPAYVISHGPSSKEGLIHMENGKPGIKIFCNNWYDFFPNHEPDYWVLANNVLSLKFLKEKINSNTKTKIIYSDSADTTDHAWIEENIKTEVIAYESRHFHGVKCKFRPNRHSLHNWIKKIRGGRSCCDNIKKGRSTIQEILMKHSGSNKHYSTASTVALHQCAVAVLMGCNPIYISGVDLDYRSPYPDGKMPTKNDYFDVDLRGILDDYKVIYFSALNLGINIYKIGCHNSIDLPRFQGGRYEL